MWPKIILFGDSQTKKSFDPDNGCWGALLADKFQRVADVVCRGFSGYNTRWCRRIMPLVFEQFDPKEIACVTIMLGSNDSIPEGSPSHQHVPVEEYRTNLSWMIDHLESIGIGKNRIILMTPPNFHAEWFNRYFMSWENFEIPISWHSSICYYVEACRSVACEKQVSLMDVYHVFTKFDDNLKLFCDGLHLSKAGGKLLYDNLKPMVTEKVTDFVQKPLEKATQFPFWKDWAVKEQSQSNQKTNNQMVEKE